MGLCTNHKYRNRNRKVNISAEWEGEIGETELGQFEDSK